MPSMAEALNDPKLVKGIEALAKAPQPSWRDPRTRIQHGLAVRIAALTNCARRGDTASGHGAGIYLLLYVKLFANSPLILRDGS